MADNFLDKLAGIESDNFLDVQSGLAPKPKPKTITQRIAGAVAPYTRHVLPMAGAMLGGAVGATGGALTTLPVAGAGAIPGGLAGAGLGLGIGQQGQNLIDQLAGLKQPKSALEEAARTGKDVVSGALMEMGGPIVGAVAGKMAKPAAKLIEKGINKAIRPSVVGKQTAAQNAKYMDQAGEAVNEILKNRNTLVLTTESGNKVAGKIPRNLNQFAEAIEQTKTAVFKKYDALNKAAGGKGAKVDLNPIADELDKVASSKIMQTHSPDVASYAAKKAESLRAAGTHTMEEAQEAIKIYNESLKSFYKNPSYETANKAAVDAAVVNQLRKQLDTVIEGAVGPGYQSLKKTYGSLKTVEKDVVHRAIVNARKNTKGLIDFTDIMTSGDIIAGLATMNPAMGFKGLA
ncbi:MAG TPA: hypothetical protein VLL97_13100, partial [Acidobacteriota bacterium]|nr:hypothetical protein [Acidobacteriota bacterium]